MTTPRFYTTTIPAAKTASQIGDLLRKYGARRYSIEFDDDGDPTALTFSMAVPALGVEVPVRLIAQTTALTTRLRGDEAKAWRVAWRQLYAWVEMCMEMVENGVKPFHEVFMADVLMEGGVRLVEHWEEQRGRLLGSGRDVQKVIALPTSAKGSSG